MAEEQENKTEETPAADEVKPAGGKKKLFLGGGVVGLLGAAYLAATMAVPSTDQPRRFQGPFVIPLFEDKFHVNLDEDGYTRFLQMNVNLVYVAYEEAYVTARIADALYQPYLRDAMLQASFTKRIEEVLGDQVVLTVYLEEIRDAVDPILFPVHVGTGSKPTDLDIESGVGPGLSIGDSTFRGRYDEHVLHVDLPAGTVRLDEGPDGPFAGHEEDLEVTNAEGLTLFLDMTAVEEEFQGEISVGVQGRVRKILAMDLLVQ